MNKERCSFCDEDKIMVVTGKNASICLDCVDSINVTVNKIKLQMPIQKKG